tara:strand:- start:119 stop:1111 length:993 start_codon:yes stop_codon:yes gene_type:complete
MPKELQWKDFKLHPQKTAFILGSSPSLMDEPLHLLNGKIVYLVNKSWKALEMGLIHKCNGLMYAGLQSWIEHIDEMKEYGLDSIPKFYSDLVVHSHEFKEHASKRDTYYLFPKRKAVSLGLDIKSKHIPNNFIEGIGKTGSVTLDMIILCYLMGFKQVYVLGMDCDYTAAKPHFYEGNTWDNHNAAPTLRHNIRTRLQLVVELLAERGVSVVQLSRGFKPITPQDKTIPTDRLENVVKGMIKPKAIGVLEENFWPLESNQMDYIEIARKKSDKVIALCFSSDVAKIMANLRFVDDTVISTGQQGLDKIKKLYPNDHVRMYGASGSIGDII